MPFSRQTLPQLIAQIKAGFQGLLLGADTALRRSNLAVSSVMMGGAVDAQYAYLDWIIDHALMPDTAEAPYSNRWGALKGVSPKGPSAATGSANFTGTATTPIPSGTQLQLQPGIVFQTIADLVLSGGGTGTVAIEAILPSPSSDGSLWNCDAGAQLSLVAAIPGVDGTPLVAADIGNGAPPEANAAFVARYLQLFRQPPQGGDQNDYVEWTLQLSAVTRAWCVPLWMGPGTVAVYFMMDVAESAHQGFPQGTNGVATLETRSAPATGDQLIVADYLFPLRPATALVYAIAPQASAKNFTLRYVPIGQQSLVEAAIAAVLLAEGAPDGRTVVELSDIQAAVKAVPQCSGSLVTSPVDNISTPTGFLPTLGTCTFL